MIQKEKMAVKPSQVLVVWKLRLHPVQRIPVTESGGRVHTSAATVAILPEAEDVDVIITD